MSYKKILVLFLSMLCIAATVSGCAQKSELTTEESTTLTTEKITTKEITTKETTTQNSEIKENTVFYLFGINDEDKNPHDLNRSDTIMVVSIDHKNKVVNVISILRDTKAEIPYNSAQKINAAFNLGGVDLAIETVNNNFDLDIKNYVTVNLSGLRAIVDAVGGIDLDLEYMEAAILNEHDCEEKFSEGVNHVNGDEALVYSRIRIIDNDVVRASRQHNVINALIDCVKDSTLVEKIKIATTCLRYVKTNLPLTKIVELLKSGVTSYEIRYRTMPDEQYETDVYSCIDEHEEWVWIYDTHAAGERIQEIIYN